MIQKPLFDRDNLERHLHSELHNYAPDAPDHLWAGIEIQLPKPRRRRRGFWVFWTCTALLFAGSIYRYTQATPTAIDSLVQPNQIKPKHAVPIKGTLLQNHLKNASGAQEIEIIDKSYDNQAIMESKFLSGSNFKSPLQIPANLLASTEKNAVKNTNYTQSGFYEKPPTLFNKPPFLPVIRQITLVMPHHEQHWEIGMLVGPVWQWQQSGASGPDIPNQLAFAEHNKGFASGWQTGISVGYRMGLHWQITTGLWRRTMTQTNSHEATLRLMDGTCLNPNYSGPKDYEFQYALLSGTGNSNLTVRISEVDSLSTMPADEPFVLLMRTSRESKHWILPLFVQHTFGKGRWDVKVQGGGAVDVPGKMMVQIDHFSEVCSDLCFNSDHMPTMTSQVESKVSLSWLFGAGVDYRLNRQWSIQATPTFFGQKGQIGLLVNTGVNLKF
ncbi:MAG: hypothetical protein IT270_14705 [Saprospiraceae bacterium]|nr:hypothetical protein [Saprospiraceae bacterium]